MPILIRDDQFEAKIKQEQRARSQKTLSKTVVQLAEERMIELQTGQLLPPGPARRRATSKKSLVPN